MKGFIQAGPQLSNQFSSDKLLCNYIKFRIPQTICAEITADLMRFGDRVVGEIWQLSQQAEKNPPQHVAYDPWGNRIDLIETHPAWQQLHNISAQEGMVAIGYERAQGEYSRLYQFAKLYLFHPSSAFYSCPLAMTDGAARMLELCEDSTLKSQVLPHLTHRSPTEFWTSGQWMTERSGGSDVSQTETIAKRKGEHFELFGDKWFSSATTADMAIALARIEGTERLSAFFIKLCDDKGKLQNIIIHRLKDKLGTKALPTAEISLQATPAKLLGKEGAGVATISTLFNVTRIYNCVCAISTIRRGIALAGDYAQKRVAFGKKLAQLPLQANTLAHIQVNLMASFHLTMHLSWLLGREETGQGSLEEKLLLRMLTPVAKLFTAKRAIAATSEVVESFGGAGYIENTGIPGLLRDAQVFSIWEGTTNVLSLDLLRAMQKDQSLPLLVQDVSKRLKTITSLTAEANHCQKALKNLAHSVEQMDIDTLTINSRNIAFSIGDIFAASLMLEFADWATQHSSDFALPATIGAKRITAKIPLAKPIYDNDWFEESCKLAP